MVILNQKRCEIEKHQIKKKLLVLPWGYEEKKDTDKKVSRGPVPRGKKAVLSGEGLLIYM